MFSSRTSSRSSFAVVSALLLGIAATPVACGSDSSGPGASTPTSQAGEFRGTFVSKDGTTGVFELRNTGVATQSIRPRDTTVYRVSGPITLTGGISGNLSGTFDSATGTFDATAEISGLGVVSLTATVVDGVATGTWTGPGGLSGPLTALPFGLTPTLYCGPITGARAGRINLVTASTIAVGVAAFGADAQPLGGSLSGAAVHLTYPGSGVVDGTVAGEAITGTTTDSAGAGNFDARTSGCPVLATSLPDGGTDGGGDGSVIPSGDKLDSTFGTGGVASIEPSTFDFTPSSGIVLADDRVVVIGYGSQVAHKETAIARFTKDGAPGVSAPENAAVSFGRQGSPDDFAPAGAVEIAPGKVAFYGVATGPNNAKEGFIEVRKPFDLTGCDSFGVNGICYSVPNTQYFVRPTGIGALGVTTTGEMLVGGTGTAESVSQDFAYMKLTSAGIVDETYGGFTVGLGLTDFGLGDEGIQSMLVAPNGAFIAGGLAFASGTPPTRYFVTAHYLASGAVDTTFGSQGKAQVAVVSSLPPRIVRNADGSYFVVGAPASKASTTIYKITAAGALDSAFGTSGKVEAPYPQGGGDIADARLDGTGRLVVGYGNFTVGRFTAAGALDPSFGFVTVPAAKVPDAALYAIGFQSDGKIIAMGGKGRGQVAGAVASMVAARLDP